MNPIHIIGGGLAGAEASWQIAKLGVPSILYEMRPIRQTAAHITSGIAELVCSNSFRSSDENNAVGLLHAELRLADSLILKCADINRIPAGGALAVDRIGFSKTVESYLIDEPLITIKREEVVTMPPLDWESVIISTGPLTSDSMSKNIQKLTGESDLAFFDAISPIVHLESINPEITWLQSRYDKGNTKDYINCPLTRDEYERFVNLLINSEVTEFKEWEKNTPYFNGCLPIEVMASRGKETLRFGPMKPVGLTNPRTKEKPYAVVQLRQDNAAGTLYNIVGFQTKMKYNEQIRILKTIPGLENADFARLGGIHRNTFINSPQLLDTFLRLKSNHRFRFAGQITGVEGYVESSAIGLLAGKFSASEQLGKELTPPPLTTAFGSLLSYITSNEKRDNFQPMNINYGLFPELNKKFKKTEKKQALSTRAKEELCHWLYENS